MKLTLYCNSYAGKDPLHRQATQHTLMCGSHYLDSTVKQTCLEKGHILDDTLKNISHLNPLLGDLTGLYWIWKNTDDEFVGTNQYRRFYDDQQLKDLVLDQNTLYVSHFLKFTTSAWNQYIGSHGVVGMDLLKKAIQLKTVNINESMFDSLWHTNSLSSCNTFFAHRNLFNKTCEILFEIIFELYRGSKYLLEYVQKDIHAGRHITDKRLLAFLAERILNIMYINNRYYFGNINILSLKYYTILQ